MTNMEIAKSMVQAHYQEAMTEVGLHPDMHGPNGQNVTVWRVTRCFCGYLMKFFEKMPKSPFF